MMCAVSWKRGRGIVYRKEESVGILQFCNAAMLQWRSASVVFSEEV